MIKINLPMPSECECAYKVIEREATSTQCEVSAWYPCPCYNAEDMTCQGVIPSRELYNPPSINELHENYRPEWCPLKEQEAVVRCKDCDNKECWGRAGDVVCGIDGTPHRPDWFCADGERK